MLNLATFLEDSARAVPKRTAVIFNETRLSYQQVNAMAGMVANGLKSIGIQPGDKVALSCPNLPFFPIVYYGILKAGGVVVPLNVLFKGREIAYHLTDSDAKAYFCFQGTADLPMAQFGQEGFSQVAGCEHFFVITADPAAPSPIPGTQTMGMLMHGQSPVAETVQTHPEDTAVILYTSGTTGQPKGAELSHSNMVMNALVSATLFDSLGQHDTHLITLPLFHSFGQTCQLNTGFYTRATLSLLPRFDPDAALGIMQRDSVTVFCGVPTMYWAMLNHPHPEKFDLPQIAANLRAAASGGSAMPVEVMRAFEEKFNVHIQEGYGLSETSPVATFNPKDQPKPGSVGIPIWGVDVRLVDAEGQDVQTGDLGEIIIRGHNIMKGYYKRPEATAGSIKDNWFYSGDIGRQDEDGYIYIVDRVKDMIIRGGFNVYPREIEEVLMTHPAVSLAAVVGVPHESHGEEVKAYIILKAGASATPEEIIAWSRENMAGYKYPRLVEIRESLPMTATGKILKRELR